MENRIFAKMGYAAFTLIIFLLGPVRKGRPRR